MNKTWQILYKGKLAERRLTRKAAQARAYELVKLKGWDISLVDVMEDSQISEN